MELQEKHFDFFSQLPTELRLLIWRLCLPNRVPELDYPWVRSVDFDPLHPTCRLMHTTDLDRKAPVLTRVCHESRLVAFETGGYRDHARSELWNSNLLVRKKSWLDPRRDTIHLNWTPSDLAGYNGPGSALDYLAWKATEARRGSFMFDYLGPYFDGEGVSLDERIGVVQKLQNAFVVMKIVVVHTTVQIVTKSGLFGLLGDAFVQLIDVTDESRLDALFKFAEECESDTTGPIACKQVFCRKSADSYSKTLKEKLASTLGQSLSLSLRPAIMFRFCPHFCNHSSLHRWKLFYESKR